MFLCGKEPCHILKLVESWYSNNDNNHHSFYYFRFEDDSEAIYLEEVEDHGSVWNRVDLDLAVKDKKYRVKISGLYTAQDPIPYGHLALDDFSFTPKCR